MNGKVIFATAIGGVLPMSVISAVAVAGFVFGGSRAQGFGLGGLPGDVVQNYRFAESHPDVVAHIPCYCGCRTSDHLSLRDCFLRPDGGYEAHASGCVICGREVDDVEVMLAEDRDLHTIRLAIDERYASYGRPTNTP